MNLNLKELIKYCKENGIKGYSNKSKIKLLELIKNTSDGQYEPLSVNNIINDNKQLKFIDLFCGIGGFHQAMTKFNYKCVFSCDIDDKCIQTYKDNYGITPFKDITKIEVNQIPQFDILCAGFPCQPFSKAGFQNGFLDARGNLFYDICRIIKKHLPKYLILENVRNLESHDNGNTWKTIYDAIDNLGYFTYKKPLILNTLHFNVPQNRERVIILGIRKNFGILPEKPIIPKKSKIKLSKTLKDIVNSKYNTSENILSIKMQSVKTIWNNFIDICHNNNIIIPKFPIWTNWWDKDINENIIYYKKYKNWIDKNRLFFKENFIKLNDWLLTSRKNPFWKGSVRKMEWQVKKDLINNLNNLNNLDDLLWSVRGSGIRIKNIDYIPTLVAMNQTPIYGPYNRKLVPYELLKLQSFNDDFKFNNKYIYKQIGNSVNVDMIYNSVNFLINNVKLLS